MREIIAGLRADPELQEGITDPIRLAAQILDDTGRSGTSIARKFYQLLDSRVETAPGMAAPGRRPLRYFFTPAPNLNPRLADLHIFGPDAHWHSTHLHFASGTYEGTSECRIVEIPDAASEETAKLLQAIENSYDNPEIAAELADLVADIPVSVPSHLLAHRGVSRLVAPPVERLPLVKSLTPFGKRQVEQRIGDLYAEISDRRKKFKEVSA